MLSIGLPLPARSTEGDLPDSSHTNGDRVRGTTLLRTAFWCSGYLIHTCWGQRETYERTETPHFSPHPWHVLLRMCVLVHSVVKVQANTIQPRTPPPLYCAKNAPPPQNLH